MQDKWKIGLECCTGRRSFPEAKQQSLTGVDVEARGSAAVVEAVHVCMCPDLLLLCTHLLCRHIHTCLVKQCHWDLLDEELNPSRMTGKKTN